MNSVDGGPAAVSVTSSWPVCERTTLWASLPPTGTVPVSVNVISVTLGEMVVVVAVESVPVLHAHTDRECHRAKE
jgi:hypothetical protein